MDLQCPRPAPALKEREAVRVEERPVAREQLDGVAGTRAVMNEPEEREQLCPGAEALVNRVREVRGVLAQALVQARDRIEAR